LRGVIQRGREQEGGRQTERRVDRKEDRGKAGGRRG
jgi:hypothetical protein